jgi:hypothetical protein
MADTKAAVQRAGTVERDMTAMAFIAPLAGWLIPGAGHVYTPNTGDILDILGFIGDIGAGGLYFLARSMDWGQGAIHKAVADYGTKYIIVAGLLNIVCIVDAYHIAIGKKQ